MSRLGASPFLRAYSNQEPGLAPKRLINPQLLPGTTSPDPFHVFSRDNAARFSLRFIVFSDRSDTHRQRKPDGD